MRQSQTIPETFLGVGYTTDRAGRPLEAVSGAARYHRPPRNSGDAVIADKRATRVSVTSANGTWFSRPNSLARIRLALLRHL